MNENDIAAELRDERDSGRRCGEIFVAVGTKNDARKTRKGGTRNERSFLRGVGR